MNLLELAYKKMTVIQWRKARIKEIENSQYITKAQKDEFIPKIQAMGHESLLKDVILIDIKDSTNLELIMAATHGRNKHKATDKE